MQLFPVSDVSLRSQSVRAPPHISSLHGHTYNPANRSYSVNQPSYQHAKANRSKSFSTMRKSVARTESLSGACMVNIFLEIDLGFLGNMYRTETMYLLRRTVK